MIRLDQCAVAVSIFMWLIFLLIADMSVYLQYWFIFYYLKYRYKFSHDFIF